ncbi:cilia- and flagella-associated protein 61 [Cheilinus undulatus]|uniref:cilia- and flagella-associated protein 61 n=1 Tax=Cheilinus undulatus TaxID=241271 RepID=UPI001BD32AFD|nr:cilia- and flagella-associated protein 61 [Cheilinus undulatus]
MRTLTSASGLEEAVIVRRTESADAQGIDSLISPQTVEIFGKVNIIHLLEKANLAVTLANENEDIVAHASFFDHPVGGLVDQTLWEQFLQKHFKAEKCSPWNTLFLHLFVARTDFETASLKEIMRAIFDVVSELDFVCLVSPHVGDLDPALDEVFEPLQRLTNPGPWCSALICRRKDHCPRMQIRPTRVEDHDDLLPLFSERTKARFERPYFLCELIEGQDEENPTAVCERDGVSAGFISCSSHVDFKRLNHNFDLREFHGLYKTQQIKDEAAQPGLRHRIHSRSVDFIPYIFSLFPDLDFCIITIPTASPEFPLLQSFYKVPRRVTCSLQDELYILHRDALRNVEVRPAVSADRPAVSDLVKDLRLSESLLQDLDCFYNTRRDRDGAALQAFVAQVDREVVGILIIRDEQDIEYIRARYNIENFVYFSHHRYEEHAQIRHFVLKPSFQHFSKHLFKEVLRLAHRSCLYLRIYPSDHSQENSCVHHLDSVLNCAVPVCPRRQIIYPLEELGINAPSRQITEDQTAFALRLISRKLTMEPKVSVNARMVVVGASDTGLSLLEVLCSCPHLKFNNLTLVSTHGFLRDCDHDHIGFLSTSYAYSTRDLAQLPFQSCITVVTGKMVGINRKSKYIRVSDGRKVAYDYLILCTGLQYQVPCPTCVDPSQQNQTSSCRCPVPSNLFTLNDLYDCRAARRWLCASFVELEENAIVYGNSIDVFTATETLLSLGIQGHRIHLVLQPPDPGVSLFGEPQVKKAVYAALGRAKVQVHHDCMLTQMDDRVRPEGLTSVSFSTDSEPLHLQCGVFINLSNKGVDYDAFRSISDSFLVFDSRLVINAAFQTSDSAIFGAGPLTKFSRCYYADEWSHANFSSKEVGQELAATLLRLFDPTLESADQPELEEDRLVPIYNQAKIQGGRLPGGYNYLNFTKPSPTIQPSSSVKQLQDKGIATGRAETGNFFCLRLDCYELVETLTCLSLKPLPVSNYLCLYGKHQQLLGQLSTVYYRGLIPDLYSFFRQSWCLAVYHDRFSDFERELQQITSAKDEDQLTDEDDDVNVSPEDRIKDPETRAALRSSAVKYLTYNRNLLPMFAYPGQL